MLSVYKNTTWVWFPWLLCALIYFAYGFHPGSTNSLLRLVTALYVWMLGMMAITIGSTPFFMENFRKILFVVLLGVTGSIWMDVINPGTFGYNSMRPAGLLLNANRAGLVIVLTTVVIIDWSKYSTFNFMVFAVAGFGVLSTFSMGGILMLGGTFFLYLIYVELRKGIRPEQLAFLIILPILLLGTLAVSGDLISEVFEFYGTVGAQKRMEQIQGIFRGNFEFVTGAERMGLVKQFWADVQAAPFVGHGIEYYRPGLGPHNMFLFVWTNIGFIGFTIFMLFLTGTTVFFFNHRHICGLVYMINIFLFCLVGHGLLNGEQSHTFKIALLAGIVAAGQLGERRNEGPEREEIMKSVAFSPLQKA